VVDIPDGQVQKVFVSKEGQGNAAASMGMKQTMVIAIRNIAVKELN
jgi:hypothetical protein